MQPAIHFSNSKDAARAVLAMHGFPPAAPVTEQDIITTIGIQADTAIAAAAGANERLKGFRAQQARIADVLKCEPERIEEEVTRVAAMVGRCVDCGRCATYSICEDCLEARR